MLKLEDIKLRPGDLILYGTIKRLVVGIGKDNNSILIALPGGWYPVENSSRMKDFHVPDKYLRLKMWGVSAASVRPIPTFPYKRK